ncbi:MAG: four helix bundle protein [Candidatus Dojkabacteria bacterium]|nr:four helix bundle protein [Candidatus Dojkabacteria bacterium]MDQ7021034.1 four helix bundle protein [Candidatus Dojkabacteria bacterium]
MVDFTKLNIWIRAKNLSVEIYRLTDDYPKIEQFGISNQMRRAATSVPANISEGCSRDSKKDFSYFLSISIGSLNEIYTFLEIFSDLKYLQLSKKNTLIKEINELKSMIYSYKKKLKTKES